ncbi:hypothetical protein [Candidatus Magnetobacterium casense]|uniref:Uncharacterized protein n=1 Tax=Candidatus Magnetobacterium casense TaxID=1455061 RepID=A0ABS6RUV4_9BACT|nr:hypothetical protein [Candidatus Magnetobacterium casensis]MBV6340361.1 hypothetical protein [Candidatus Magnetobacterium casensis]
MNFKMALSTIVKRATKSLSSFGGDSRVIKTTTSLGGKAKSALEALTGRTKVVSRTAAGVADTSADAAKSRKILGTPVNKEGLGIKSAAAKAVKGAGYGAMVVIPLAAGGYGVAKLGEGVGKVREGIFGPSAEDIELQRLTIIERIIEKGYNPADFGWNDQNKSSGKDGTDSPIIIMPSEQPTSAKSKQSVAESATQVILVGGAVALALMVGSHFLKKKK